MIKVAVLGFGVVGSGVADVLCKNSEKIAESAREKIELKYILDIKNSPESEFSEKIIKDFDIIEKDEEIKIVAECIGGKTAALSYVRRALLAGKSVVTSNKELVATHGLELLQIAKEKRVSLLFEASVGGGTPIIRPLAQCLASNRIEEIHGILNGTTNYILSQMIQCEKSFEEALKEAQTLGYAEADPTADIEGIDACRKISILADLCFGKNIPPEKVETEGIKNVTAQDAALAQSLGYGIKLLGRAFRTNGDDKITAYVAPHLVAADTLLANVSGVMNGITVRGNAVGECLFYGPGAGQLPTASAVVADIIDAALHADDKKYINWEKEAPELFIPAAEIKSRWFIRTSASPEKAAETLKTEKIAKLPDQCAAISPPMKREELKNLNLKILSAFRILE